MTWERQRAYDFDEGKEAGLIEGREEGAQQKAIEGAINLLKEGDSPEKISRCIGLPLEKVLELQSQISKKA
jgi:predicted transposase YdaD